MQKRGLLTGTMVMPPSRTKGLYYKTIFLLNKHVFLELILIILIKKLSAWSKTTFITVRRKCISMSSVLFQKISVGSRSLIINDAFNLARAGLLKQVTALNLTRYITSERDYVPWKTIGDVTSYIGDMLSKTRAYGYFQVCCLIHFTINGVIGVNIYFGN